MTRTLLGVIPLLCCALIAFGSRPRYVNAVTIRVDYSLDGSGFFNPSTTAGQQARASVNAAADFYSDLLLDTFSPVNVPPRFFGTAGGFADFFLEMANPTDPFNSASPVRFSSYSIAQNEYVVFVGGATMGGTQLASAGVGGTNVDGQFFSQADLDAAQLIYNDFSNTVQTRGETSGFAHWGGTISFDNDGSTNWHRNHNAMPPGGKSDLYSVALHEMGHVLGFSRSTMEDLNLLSGANGFKGPNAMAEYGGVVPLQPGGGHWAEGMMSHVYNQGTLQETLYDPSFNGAIRKSLTMLDAAGLSDIGWTVAAPTVLPGDFNGDSTVDAVDYAVWRSGLGSQYTAADYDLWRQNYGTSSTATAAGSPPVPAPYSAALLLVLATFAVDNRRR